MLYKSQIPIERLKKRSDFVSVTQNGKKFVTKNFVLLYVLNNSGVVRLGFTASKKVGNAVKRNRAKRRMRALTDEFIRLNPQFFSQGMDMVMVARYSLPDIDFTKIHQDFAKMLEKI